MRVDLGVALPTDTLAPLAVMEQQMCQAPLDLRLKKGECLSIADGQATRPAGQLESRGAGSWHGEWDRLGPSAALPGEIGSGAFGRRVSPLTKAEGGQPWRGAGKQEARKGVPTTPPQQPAVPDPEQAGTGAEGKWKAERARISLPPRKRPYTASEDVKPAVPAKVAQLEEDVVPRGQQLGPVRLKTEPEERLVYCRGQEPLLSGPLATVNGYSYLEPVYMPIGLRQLPYYAGVNKHYLSTPFPLCPVPTHPIPIGPLPAFHSPPCPILCAREDVLASDIAMATRQDEDGDTPLHIAVVQEDVAMVQKLIQFLRLGKKDLDIYNNLRQTPLHLAVITKQASVVGELVANGASRVLLDRHGQTAAHLACEHSSLECLQSLLGSGQESIDLEIRNYDGYTPLHVAVNSRHKEIVSHLLDQGADVDAVDIKSGRSPLVHAVENNCMEMVILLLQHGANVNLQTYSGNTALHSCSGRGLMEIVKVLLKNGADSSVKNCHNDTSLMVAKNKKVIDILRGKASRTVLQPPPSQRPPSVVKDWDSPSSKSNSPLPTPNVLGCPSPSGHQARSPQHLHLPSAASPPRSSPSNRSSASPPSRCQSSPPSARSHPGTPMPDVEDRPEEMSLSVEEQRGPPVCRTYTRELAERHAQPAGSRACSPTPTPPAHPAGHCPPMFYHGLVGHPVGSFALPPFHERRPTAEGPLLNFLAGPLPALPHPAFATHPQCPPNRRPGAQPVGIKEWQGNPSQPKHIQDSLQPPLHHQARPSSRNCDRSDITVLRVHSVGRGES